MNQEEFVVGCIVALGMCLLGCSAYEGNADAQWCDAELIERMPECLTKSGEVHISPLRERCSYNFSFVNFHPMSEEMRSEPDSMKVNPCSLCAHFKNLKELVITKEAIRNGYLLTPKKNKQKSVRPILSSRELDEEKAEEILSYFPESEEEMVKKISGVSEYKRGDKPFGKCAAVGNSGKLLRENYGRYIDSFDVVMRFNRAPTKEYQQFVGKKTTFRMLNTGRGKEYWHEGHEILLMRAFESEDFDLLKNVTNQVYFLQPNHKPQFGADGTGTIGIKFLSLFCKEVHVFGYGSESFVGYSHYFPSIIHSVSHPKSSRVFLRMAHCLNIIHVHD